MPSGRATAAPCGPRPHPRPQPRRRRWSAGSSTSTPTPTPGSPPTGPTPVPSPGAAPRRGPPSRHRASRPAPRRPSTATPCTPRCAPPAAAPVPRCSRSLPPRARCSGRAAPPWRSPPRPRWPTARCSRAPARPTGSRPTTPPSGAPRWSATTGGHVESAPAVGNGVVYVGSDDGKLSAYDANGVTGCSGTPVVCTSVWSATTGGAVRSSPAVNGTSVYVGSDAGTLSAYGLPQIGFGKSALAGTSSTDPTAIRFGPDGRLYVAEFDGLIKAYTITRNGPDSYAVTATETISLVQQIPNHDDDGTLDPSVTTRLVTGLLVTGSASNPVLYVTSSDPRVGGGVGGTPTPLDTNSGVVSRLTRVGGVWSGATWCAASPAPRRTTPPTPWSSTRRPTPSTWPRRATPTWAPRRTTSTTSPSTPTPGRSSASTSAPSATPPTTSPRSSTRTTPRSPARSAATSGGTRRRSPPAARCRCTRRATATPTP